MKRLLFTVIALLATIYAFADESGTCGENLTWTYVESTNTLTISGTGNMCDFTNYNEAPWYNFREQITTITISDEVKSIGQNAFYEYTGLTSITIPNSVTSIGDHAFCWCTGLTSIEIPNSVTSIGDAAFSGCTGLTSIEVASDNTIFDSRDNCNAIIKTITNTLIVGCKNTIIPNSVTSIERSAFSGCTGLTSITIPNSVTSIGNWAFQGCTGLTSITIPNSVTSIEIWAFKGCTGLTSITIPNSVTSIGNYAFVYCTGLTSIEVASDNTIFDSRDNCNAIIKTITNTLIVGCKNTIIPNSVTSIGNCAFFGCTGLTSIEIPNSVTSIGSAAFEDCTGLTSITIPNSVTSIGNYAFEYCTGLTSIEIPNSVTSIGSAAFEYCTGLTSITIPNSVTSIGDRAFYGCTGLTSITIPNSVTSIGEFAFWECTKIKDVLCYAEQCPTINKYVFGNTPLEEATLHVPSGSVDLYKAHEIWGKFGNIVALSEEEMPTIINSTKLNAPVIIGIYDLTGNPISQMQRGVNIIRMSDGTTRKLMVR